MTRPQHRRAAGTTAAALLALTLVAGCADEAPTNDERPTATEEVTDGTDEEQDTSAPTDDAAATTASADTATATGEWRGRIEATLNTASDLAKSHGDRIANLEADARRGMRGGAADRGDAPAPTGTCRRSKYWTVQKDKDGFWAYLLALT